MFLFSMKSSLLWCLCLGEHLTIVCGLNHCSEVQGFCCAADTFLWKLCSVNRRLECCQSAPIPRPCPVHVKQKSPSPHTCAVQLSLCQKCIWFGPEFSLAGAVLTDGTATSIKLSVWKIKSTSCKVHVLFLFVLFLFRFPRRFMKSSRSWGRSPSCHAQSCPFSL